MQIGKSLIRLALEEATGTDAAAASTGKEDEEVVDVVLVAVRARGSVDDHAMVKQGAIAFAGQPVLSDPTLLT